MTLDIQQTGRVLHITLNRPHALNALNQQMFEALMEVLVPLDTKPDIGCIVISGAGKGFCAGADIKVLANKSYAQLIRDDMFVGWEAFSALRTPKIAAVSGFALGGGCELAMMCDTIYAAQNAQFGQPEINLGFMPGMGGSQRLTRLIGRVKAMDMILTGRKIGAEEAERIGLVARIFDEERMVDEVLKIAKQIAGFGKNAAVAAREAINRAEETSLSEGLLFERRAYHSLWNTQDCQEGMTAFIEKRSPVFKHC